MVFLHKQEIHIILEAVLVMLVMLVVHTGHLVVQREQVVATLLLFTSINS